jgi:preprotein translocase subunit SecE
MGRILRKKSTGLKKKKKSDAASPASVERPDGAAAAQDLPAAGADAAAAAKTRAAAVPKKPTAPASQPVPVAPPDNLYTRSVQFLREVKIELKKVTWPSRKQTLGSTMVVLVLVMIISIFLGVVDMGLSSLVRAVFNQ